MANNSDSNKKTKSSQPPAPEVLKVQSDGHNTNESKDIKSKLPKINKRLKHGTYKPSHRATFIGIAVVVGILAINVVVIYFVIKDKSSLETGLNQDEITISSEVLDTLGVSRNSIGDTGTQLTIGPNTSFNGNVVVNKDIDVAGQLSINGDFSASSAALGSIEAGDASVQQINVNGDATATNLALRSNLAVVGSSQLQGAVTISQLLTVNNSVNVLGNLSVGGTLSMGGFQTNILTVGGHIITRGNAPALTAGTGLGNNGTASISGNDVAGTIAVNFGTNGGNGTLASINFVTAFSNIPKVVITPIGCNMHVYLVSRTQIGFTVATSTVISSAGCTIDYIVMQ